MQPQPTYNPPAWTQLHWSESVTLTGECHTPPTLQGTTLSSTVCGKIAPSPWTKLNTIVGEHNSPLPGRDRVECGTSLWEWGWGEEPTSQSRGEADHWVYLLELWMGHNTDLPYLVGGGTDLLAKVSVEWLSCHLVKTETYLTTLENLVVSDQRAQLQVSVGRRNQQLLTNQPPAETTLEITPVPDGLPHQGNSGLKNPEPTPP
jgi:hypothetical protein